MSLNEFGKEIWKHKCSRVLFAERPYSWVDRIVIIDETKGRTIVDDRKFTMFDFKNWIPMTVEEFSKVKHYYKEIYDT